MSTFFDEEVQIVLSVNPFPNIPKSADKLQSNDNLYVPFFSLQTLYPSFAEKLLLEHRVMPYAAKIDIFR